MSYASVAASNTLPVADQPKPDPGLLEGPTDDIASGHANQTSRPDVDSKINTVPADWSGKSQFEEDLDRSVTESKETDEEKNLSNKKSSHNNHNHNRTKRPAEKLDKVSKKAKRELEKPSIQFGLMTILNLSVLTGVGFVAFKNWDKPHWDRRIVSATVIGLGALFGSQGYLGSLFYDQKKRF
ncbi:hypothetical protein CROQUDRAFT_663729 [Cronartium quercuum f. sp. fusiforme G11]|uniref:Mitochondrial outer membrane protein OM14 C-terminal domain-containing protein n=1 Tax=Cronartium quercuum f. sp. fusiforme G11 TaxID=708437 RepID=A0A9P6T741_9BASI|nr:hypothetical protein CROQUDRAFT_663729 [Cronartium quercuum f. sp. fusiforme G11]